MKIDDVLKAAPKAPKAHDHTVVYLNGAVEADHDPAYFRLYRSPQNRRSYLVVKKEDLAGDLQEWTPEEATKAGFVGRKIHNVPVKHGAEVQGVLVKMHRIGEPMPGKAKPAPTNPQPADQVCCCDNCADTGTCRMADSSDCAQFGVVCPGSC